MRFDRSDQEKRPLACGRLRVLGSAPALSLLVTFALLTALLWHVPLTELLAAVRGADLVLVAAAALLSVLCTTLQTAELRRQALRTLSQDISFRTALLTTAGTLALHHSLPAGSGAAVSIAYLRRHHAVDVPRGALAFGLVFWLKLCWMLGLATLGWVLLPESDAIRGGTMVAVLLVTMVGGGLVWLSRHRVVGLLGDRGWRGKLAQLLAGLQETPIRASALAWTVSHALLSVLSDLLVFGLLLAALGAKVEPLRIVALLPLCLLGARVPITTMGIGTREALILAFFAGTADAQILLAAGLLYSFIEHLLPALLGSVVTGHFLARLRAPAIGS